ncbi:MAG: hypothetical protein HY860_06260 [Chlamydiales bacterium]|nr:hypothetical protein [Chlamydiales bacterium]
MDTSKVIIVSFFCIYFSAIFGQVIEIVPPSHDSLQTFFSNDNNTAYEQLDFWSKVQYKLEQKGHYIYTTDLSDIPRKRKKIDKYLPWKKLKQDVDKILVINLPYYMHSQKIYNLPKEKLILFMLEPPSIIPQQYDMRKMKKHFHKIFTFDDSLVDNKTVFQFYYPVCNAKICQKVAFHEKKFLCTISANKSSPHPDELYMERKKAIGFFDKLPKGTFDLYGIDWEKENYKNYKGKVNNKIDVMQNYKFSICYENIAHVHGYITEKIFDSFQAGCVPVYLGAENITDYIPANCFIDKRNFDTYDELVLFLQSIDEATYLEYIKHIDEFLSSEKGQKYNPENLINLLVEAASS